MAMALDDIVTIYTDGACIGNPGAGGYGVLMLQAGRKRELSRGFRRTTNNRMELMAAIEGLRALKGRCRVVLYSDSQYVVNAVNQGWAIRWKANGWRRNKKEAALNPDLWDDLLSQVDRHEVEFQWVRGHAGDPGNERADALAVKAARGGELAVDRGYKP
jgi:ribonuclease HI